MLVKLLTHSFIPNARGDKGDVLDVDDKLAHQLINEFGCARPADEPEPVQATLPEQKPVEVVEEDPGVSFVQVDYGPGTKRRNPKPARGSSN